MTTDEIKDVFKEIGDECNDGLDAFIKLANYKEQYEMSDFYKITQLSIFDAYIDYYRTTMRWSKFIKDLQKALNEVDYSQLEKTLGVEHLFDQIPEEYKDYFKEFLNQQTQD